MGVRLEDHLRSVDELLKQLIVTEAEREVVFYCSNLVELVELGEAFVDLLIARVCLEDGEGEHGALDSCQLSTKDLTVDFVNAIESQPIVWYIACHNDVDFYLGDQSSL